jgi:hypothetical protein
MAKVTVELDYQAIGELLRTPEMEAEMVRRGKAIMAHAIAHAPVAKEGRTRGRYKASFHLEHGRAGLPGATVLGDRAWAEVINDAPEALYVEYGRAGAEPYHVLLRALVEGGRD